jgi:hypothetical protein
MFRTGPLTDYVVNEYVVPLRSLRKINGTRVSGIKLTVMHPSAQSKVSDDIIGRAGPILVGFCRRLTNKAPAASCDLVRCPERVLFKLGGI